MTVVHFEIHKQAVACWFGSVVHTQQKKCEKGEGERFVWNTGAAKWCVGGILKGSGGVFNMVRN